MKSLVIKELKLATPALTYIFMAFALMTFIPGYPILCGGFFICFGIFQSYMYQREANDILYSVLLPVGKKDVVKAKYITACIIELAAFLICVLCTIVRMTLVSGAAAYANNFLMAANPVFLAFMLIIFAEFNLVFIGGFFKTAYGTNKPFLIFAIVTFIIITIAETLHHIPGLSFLNDIKGSAIISQLLILLIAALLYVVITLLSCRKSMERFERIDL